MENRTRAKVSGEPKDYIFFLNKCSLQYLKFSKKNPLLSIGFLSFLSYMVL